VKGVPAGAHPPEEAFDVSTPNGGSSPLVSTVVDDGAELIGRRELLRAAAAVSATLALGSMPAALRIAAARAAPGHLGPSALDATVATSWFDQLSSLAQVTPGFSPPVASRAFGYAGVALYETVAAGSADHRSLAGQLRELDEMPRAPSGPLHWGLAANAALAAIARGLWPTAPGAGHAAVTALEQRFARQLRVGTAPGLARRSERWGQQLATSIVAWSAGDGAHEGYLHNFPSDYTTPQGPGLWVPTAPGFLPALQPRWGGNRPFCLTSPTACLAGAPTPYAEDPSSRWYAEALEVHDVVDALTAEQGEIARFWADDPGATSTPPGHSISIATQQLRSRDADLLSAAELYARVGIAVADAFVACWYVKYATNVQRPITTIQALIDPAWGGPERPLPVTTPPFPEYPSGHSVQSAAVARVLTSAFGADVPFTDRTHDQRGFPPRTFTSFNAAAAEAALSRLYGGIHFRPAIEDGLVQGHCIGEAANGLMLRA
jgi:hypothetical protein